MKALFIEPLLILGAFILWLVVLPLAGLFLSGATLWKCAAMPDLSDRRQPFALGRS